MKNNQRIWFACLLLAIACFVAFASYRSSQQARLDDKLTTLVTSINQSDLNSCLLDERGIFVAWSNGCENMFDLPRTKVIGENTDFLIPEERREEHNIGFTRVAASRKPFVSQRVNCNRLANIDEPVEVNVDVIDIGDDRFFQGNFKLKKNVSPVQVTIIDD